MYKYQNSNCNTPTTKATILMNTNFTMAIIKHWSRLPKEALNSVFGGFRDPAREIPHQQGH